MNNTNITVTTEDGGYTAQCATSVKNYKVITYTATSKLPETTSTFSGGLHTNAFSGTSGQRLTMVSHTFEDGVGTVTLNGDIAKFGDFAFYSATTLASIDIPDSVTSIGGHAFNGCSGLKTIEIPDSVTSIGTSAFTYCTGLTSIEIPDSVTSIGEYAFTQCSGLTSVTIGSGVKSIRNSVFYNCRSLTSIVSNAMIAPTITYSTFGFVKTNGTLYVPSGSSGYDTWMQNSSYYLGLYNWTKVEQ